MMMYKQLVMILSCLGFVTFGLGQTSPNTAPKTERSKEETEQIQEWQKGLRQAFTDVSSAIVIDLDIKEYPPQTRYSSINDESEFVDLISAFLGREPRPLSNGWALIRTASTAATSTSAYTRLTQWLSQVPDDELKLLAGPGVPFNQLSKASRMFIASQCDESSLQTKMANGALAVASMRMAFLGEVVDKSGKKLSTLIDPFARDSKDEEALREKVTKTYDAPKQKSQIKQTLSGNLDLSSGEVLTFGEVVKKANLAFKKDFVFDQRLAETFYYWQGRFNEKTFLEYLKVIQKPFEPVDQAKSAQELRDILKNSLKYKIAQMLDPSLCPKGLTMDDALNGKSLTASALSQLVPSWAGNVTNYGLSPDSPVKLTPGLSLYLVSPGAQTSNSRDMFGYRWSIVYYP